MSRSCKLCLFGYRAGTDIQSSFTPFTSEAVYQALLPTTPAPTDTSLDTRSVHFLPFPTVREEYFDTVIERQVKRLKAVIELGRGIRDKHNLKTKVSRRWHNCEPS